MMDGDNDSIVVVQRQMSSPPGDHVAINGRVQYLHRQESAPAFNGVSPPPNGVDGSPSRPDSLAVVIDDLAKMTQELGMLEENIFTTG